MGWHAQCSKWWTGGGDRQRTQLLERSSFFILKSILQHHPTTCQHSMRHTQHRTHVIHPG